MQLSRDQRAVLEAVYAIEKLPDASLRERLGGYLSLTTRRDSAFSIQVCVLYYPLVCLCCLQQAPRPRGQAGSSQDSRNIIYIKSSSDFFTPK